MFFFFFIVVFIVVVPPKRAVRRRCLQQNDSNAATHKTHSFGKQKSHLDIDNSRDRRGILLVRGEDETTIFVPRLRRRLLAVVRPVPRV